MTLIYVSYYRMSGILGQQFQFGNLNSQIVSNEVHVPPTALAALEQSVKDMGRLAMQGGVNRKKLFGMPRSNMASQGQQGTSQIGMVKTSCLLPGNQLIFQADKGCKIGRLRILWRCGVGDSGGCEQCFQVLLTLILYPERVGKGPVRGKIGIDCQPVFR